uniref:Secreted protein n=1 Tax=Parascaris equorum TaxID=6256 RepID=A0A914RBM5_PAREQ
MSLKRIILLLYHAVATASQSSPCLLRCKDNNMNEIEKILGATTDWTTDLVAPMHSILRGLSERGNSHTVLTNRLRSICKLVPLIYLQNACALFCADRHQRKLSTRCNYFRFF